MQRLGAQLTPLERTSGTLTNWHLAFDTERAAREYLDIARAIQPETVQPIDPASVLSPGDLKTANSFTPDSPMFYKFRGQVNCSFVMPCTGDDCPGVLIARSGEYARSAREEFCPVHAMRWILTHEPEIDAARQAARAVRETERSEWFKKLVPPFYHGFTLDNYPGDRAALASCRRWLDERAPEQGLVLLGSFGTGKTSLAVAIFRELCIKIGKGGIFMAGGDLLTKLRPGMGQDENLPWRMRDADLLVIDDIGAEQPTEWTREQWFNIIAYRHDNLRPIILTSNHPSRELSGLKVPEGVETLEDRIGERAVQRLLDRNVYAVQIVKGGNLRKAGRAAA